MSREEMLARVRQAAQQGSRYRVHTVPVPDSAGYVGASADLCEALAAEITAVGGEAVIAASVESAQSHLVRYLRQHNVTSVVRWRHTTLDTLQLAATLAEESVQSHDHESLAALPFDQQRAVILAAPMGITAVDFAVAETGTLVVCARPGQERLMSLVPPIHLAFVRQSDIVPDLFDLFARFQERRETGLPSNIALISGPSKTGDIELELTTGVHGPGRWIVVIVRQM